jgi:hypothetical protein
MMKKACKLLRDSYHVVLLLALSFGVRVYMFGHMHPVIHTDSITFLFLREVDIVRTPGYPFFIELILSLNDILSLSTDYFQVICFGQMFILGVLNAYLIYRLAGLLTSSRTFALIAGILYNFNFFVVGFELQIMTETLSITLLLALLLLSCTIVKGKINTAFLAGLVSVALILTRPTYLLLWLGLAVLGLIVYLPRAGRREFFHAFGPTTAIFLMINIFGIGAWVVRNKIKYDYTGISTLMPYQLRYYTDPLFEKYQPSGDPRLDRVAQIYAEELQKTGRSSVSIYNFHARLRDEMGLSDMEITNAFLKVNLKLIKDYPGDYLGQLPDSILSYYMQYSSQWAGGNTRIFINKGDVIQVAFRLIFQFYRALFLNPYFLVCLMIIAPVTVLIFVLRRKERLLTWLILQGAIHYTCAISVISTKAGINNLRYRQPVEPLILLLLYASLFYLGKTLHALLKQRNLGLKKNTP